MFLSRRNCFNIDPVRRLMSSLFPAPAATGYSPSCFYHRITKPNFIQLMHFVWKIFSLSVLVSLKAPMRSEFLWMYQDVKLNGWCLYHLPLFTLFILSWVLIRKRCPGSSSPNPSSHKKLHHTTLLIKQYPTTQSLVPTHCIHRFDRWNSSSHFPTKFSMGLLSFGLNVLSDVLFCFSQWHLPPFIYKAILSPQSLLCLAQPPVSFTKCIRHNMNEDSFKCTSCKVWDPMNCLIQLLHGKDSSQLL